MGVFQGFGAQFKKTAHNLSLLFIGAFIGILAIAMAGFYTFREPVLKYLVIGRISRVTGFPIEVKSLQHEFPLKFTLRGVTMYNPPGYKPKVFATSDYFYIDLNAEDLIKGDVFHINEWRLIIDELHLEKNKEGIINGSILKSIKNFMKIAPPPPSNNVPPSKMSFLMDRLELKIKEISYRDRSGVVPRKTIKNLKLDATVFENTTRFSLLMDEISGLVIRDIHMTRRMELSPFMLEKSLKSAGKAMKDTTDMMAKGAEGVVKTPTVVTEKTGEFIGNLIGIRTGDSKIESPPPSPVPSPRISPNAVSSSPSPAAS